MTGTFVTLEGGEGVGKSTLARALFDRLSADGYEVIVTREPGGSDAAERIRSLVLSAPELDRRAQSLLFAAARADHVAKVIRPALSRGAIVVCDRFTDSTWAYQGGDGGLTDEELLSLEAISTLGLSPDVTFMLDGDPNDLLARRIERGTIDSFEDKSITFHARVRARFLERAKRQPERIMVIDALRSQDDVLASCLLGLEPVLGRMP